MYSGLVPLFDECKKRAVSRDSRRAPRWMVGSLGRYRRFPETSDDKVKGDLERQAQNFPIQGLIADVVSIAAAKLYGRQCKGDVGFQLCLQVHDELISIVHKDSVEVYIEDVLPSCMRDAVPIYPRYLDGTPQGTGPYYLGIDSTVCTHWGVTPTPDVLEDLGIDPKYSGWQRTESGLIHPEAFYGKVWRDGALHDKTG